MFYYAGHGSCQDNITKIVLNDEEKRYYPMEQSVRSWAQNQGAYVLAIFDCCREDTNRERYYRGVTREWYDHNDRFHNLMIFNGCPPNQ